MKTTLMLVCAAAFLLTSCSDDDSPAPGLVDTGIDPAAVAGVVWHDLDGDGIQDATETDGMPGVTVSITDCATAIEATATGSTGGYSFTGLDAGSYAIKVDLPLNHFFSPQDQGSDDGLDSDADVTTGQTGCFTLHKNDIVGTVDIGLYLNGTLAGRVWLDSDQDGIQDGGELGVSGNTVILRDPATGGTLASTTTDTNGQYWFNDLEPDAYQVEVTINVSFTFSPVDQGGDDALDSDIIPGTGLSPAMGVTSGGIVAIDAGIYNAP